MPYEMADATQAAQSSAQNASPPPGPDLKYLGFFRVAFIKAYAFLTTLYEYAKGSSGVLKPGLENVEGTVKTVVGPVYSKLEGKPDELLAFVDKKVDAILTFADECIPGFVKAKTSQAYSAAKATPGEARKLIGSVQEKGFFATGSDLYNEYSPIVFDYGYGIWKYALTWPLVPQLVNAVAPGALYVGETYNTAVFKLNKNETIKPYAQYLPVLDTKKIDSTIKSDTAAVSKKSS